MLRITVNKSASAAKKYYSEAYYSEGKAAHDYYLGKEEQSIGTWHGKATEKLGLSGDINKDDFALLCDNINPATGQQLTGRNDAGRRVGYDFTFNASKSVSLAYAFAGEEDKKQILQAFQDSVKDAMLEVEQGIQARVRQKGANENRDTGNIAYGEFIHFTSRPVDNVPDPHLHAHCFVLNATYDDTEQKWKAGQFGQIKQDAPYYEAIFHSALAQRLNALGYVTEQSKNGFELKGIHRETIDKFSRRTEEIEHLAAQNNITDKEQKSALGAKTREGKRNSVEPELQAEIWQSRLTKEEAEIFASLKKSPVADEKKKENRAKEAVKYSLDHHLERKSVVTDKEILATAIKSSIGKVKVEEVKEAFQNETNVIAVKEKSQTFITTQEALREENNLIAKAYQSKGAFKPLFEHYTPANEHLTDEQKKAVQHALTTSDGITIIAGKAGTGKTTLMKEVQAGIHLSGRQLFAFAPSAEASRMVQRKEGFENATTVAALIQNKTLQEQLKGSVLWIDEAGMLSNKDMNKILDIAKKQDARVILTGDIKQHNSVERGDALRTLQTEAGIRSIQVSKIQRQQQEQYKQAVDFLGKADVDKGFGRLEKIGAIHEIDDHAERISRIAEDYYDFSFRHVKKGKEQNEVLVVSPTHAEGEKVTERIRKKLREKEILAIEEQQFTTFKNLQLTEAEKKKQEHYTDDRWIIFHQNCRGFKAGSKYKITQAKGNNQIELKDGSGKQAIISLEQSKNFNLFEERNTAISKGDKIRITGNGRAADGKHLFNGTLYHVNGFDKQGNIRLSNGSTISKDYGHFSLGYVVTSHASQGKTVDKVIISQSSMSFRASSKEQFYVSVSRGRQAVAIYTDDKADLLSAVRQSNQRTSARELTKKKAVMNDAVTVNRNSLMKRIREKAQEAAQRIRSSINKQINVHHELYRKTRSKDAGKGR